MNFPLSSSIQACRQLTKQANSNFVPAFALLPKEKRQAIEILYAYNRFTDDIADSSNTSHCRLQKLNQWKNSLNAILNNSNEPLPDCDGLVYLPALKMIVDKYEIPKEPFFQLIDGMKTDIERKPFATFDDCLTYCDQVAGSVGIASLSIWGTARPLASECVLDAAKACSIAFQWTNIIRDLREDYQSGRIYLPQSDLQFFDITPAQFGTMLEGSPGKPNEKLYNLLAFQLDRCKTYYERSLPLFEFINRDSLRAFGLMWNYYYALYVKMVGNPMLVTQSTRLRLPFLQKVRLWLCWRFLPYKSGGR